MHPCRNHRLPVAVLILVVVNCALVLVSGSYPEAIVQNGQQHSSSSEQQQQEDEDDNNGVSSSECLIPCPHIYDPVCAATFEDNSSAEEVREFPNECTMNRFNCEWNKRFRVVDAERCGENNDESTMMPSGAAAAMRMHLP